MSRLSKLCSIVFFGLLALLTGGVSLHSQIHIVRLEINPLNRVIIYCSDVPEGFSSKLSNDKQKVVVLLKNTLASDSAREAHSLGIITDVYAQPFKNNVEISILLKDKRGYTAASLIYSKALMVEVFKWDQLSPAEDEYRTALLAFESGILNTAKDDFEKAVNLGNSDAAAFLGIMELQTGEIKSSLQNLIIAYKSQTKIPDTYAALSQIMKMNNHPSEASSLADMFYKMSKLKSFPQLVVPEPPDSAMSEKNCDSLLRELSFLITKDSAALAIKADTAKKDTSMNQKFKNIIQTEKKAKEKKEAFIELLESLFPPGYGKVILVFVIIIIIIALIFIFRYFKWRNEQLIQKSEKKKPSGYGVDFKKSGKTLPMPGQAVNAYNKTGAIVDKKIGGGEPKPSDLKKRMPDSAKVVFPPESFESKLEKIANEIEDYNKNPSQANPPDVKEEEYKKHLTAKLELALHLQEEQQKLKQKSLQSMDSDEITTDKEKLLEVAKKLGIETSSLSLKKQISDLGKDKETISKLAKKFDVDSDNKNE